MTRSMKFWLGMGLESGALEMKIVAVVVEMRFLLARERLDPQRRN